MEPDRPQMIMQYGECTLRDGQLRARAHTHTLTCARTPTIGNIYCFSTEKNGFANAPYSNVICSLPVS